MGTRDACACCGSYSFKDDVCVDCEHPREAPAAAMRPARASTARQPPASTKAAAEHAKRLLAALDAPPPGPARRPKRNPLAGHLYGPRPGAKPSKATPNWFDVYAQHGAPKKGERGHVPSLLPEAQEDALMGRAAALLQVWHDPELGPALMHRLAWDGLVDDPSYPIESEPDEDENDLVELGIATVDPGLTEHAGLELFARMVGVLSTASLGATENVLPELLQIAIVGDALDAHASTRPRLVGVSKELAIDFVRRHHSELPSANTKGLLYAIGVAVGERLVAVGLGTTPSGQFSARACSKHGILELSRIASDGTVPGASSMLASRLIDLIPKSGRYGVEGCLLVTYSLITEKGTTYLALADKGLRPVAYNRGKRQGGGARKGATGEGQHAADKIVWEAGPYAKPPRWDVLARTAAVPQQVAGAAKQFEAWERRQGAEHARKIRAAMGPEALPFAQAEQAARPGVFWDEVVRVLERSAGQQPQQQRQENPVKKLPRRGPWYAGHAVKIDAFDPAYVGRGNDSLGPGFYFASDLKTARAYGEVIHRVEIAWRRTIDPYKPPPTGLFNAFMDALPPEQWEIENDTNWGERTARQARAKVEESLWGLTLLSLLDLLPGTLIWYGDHPRRILDVLVRAGYTGFVVPAGSHVRERTNLPEEWAVVWDASAIHHASG